MNPDLLKLYNMRTEKWFALETENEDSAALRLYGIIGGDWFDDGVNAGEISDRLAKLKAKTLNVHINSPGGSVWDGCAIYNSLRAWSFANSEREIVVHVDGCAGSIASVIAMAGQRIIMPKASEMFIHNPWTVVAGNAKLFDAVAKNLREMGATICRIYADRTGQPSKDIEALMDGAPDDGTYLSPERALELGFCTEVLETVKAAACDGAEILGRLCGHVDKGRIDVQNIVNAIHRNTQLLKRKD